MRRSLILLALLVGGALVIVALLASPTDLGLQDPDTPDATAVPTLDGNQADEAGTLQLYSSDGVLLDEQPESADFVQYVREQLLDDSRFLGGDAAQRIELMTTGGLVVETTLNLEMQQATLAAGGVLWGRYTLPDGLSFAVVSIEPETGAIRIMADPWEGEAGEIPANLSTDLRREPSGVFKGLTMVAAVQLGIGPEDVVSGIGPCGTLEYPLDNSGWSPGRIAPVADQVLASSECAAWRMGELIGTESLARVVTGMGVHSPLPADDGLAVGQVLVTPLDMASAYATVAAVGRTMPPYVIERVSLGDGTVLYDRSTDAALRGEQVLRNTAACQATDVFVEVVERGSPIAAGQFEPERPVGGKAGGDDDAWFAGFTPDLATVVWMGILESPAEFLAVSEDFHPTRVTGSWIPAEFFALVNERYHADLPVRAFPEC